MEEKTRKVISSRMRKYVAVCVQDVVGKETILVQFKHIQRREMSASSLQYLFSKEEVGLEVDYNIYDLPKRGQC